MGIFYITGGRQWTGAEGHIEWFSYREAVVVRLDTATGGSVEVLTYETPAEARPSEERSNIVFKAGALRGDSLHVCTQTEILEFTLPDFALVHRISHPWLNDVHHVHPLDDGGYLVADTGLDMVLDLDTGGTVRRQWGALGQDPWERFDQGVDYRRVVTTKPHAAHPNYVFLHDGDIWCTRLEQRDAVMLADPGVTIQLPEKPHDGIVTGDRVWFTSVDGRVYECEISARRIVAEYDLNVFNDTDKALGWCRGLHLLGEGRVLVGFSRLRPTRIKKNVTWVKHRLGLLPMSGYAPTRVACYDLPAGSLEWEVDLEPTGLNAVFSILGPA